MADFFCPFPCAIPLDICHSPSISAILSAFLCQISFGTNFVLFIATGLPEYPDNPESPEFPENKEC